MPPLNKYESALMQLALMQSLYIHIRRLDSEWTAFEVAKEVLKEKVERLGQKPLTLEELKEHLSKRHPYEIEPLYVVFDPPKPIDYAPRWRDAYNLSQLIAAAADDYGKTWLAYRYPPNEDTVDWRNCPNRQMVEGGIPYCENRQTACDGCRPSKEDVP